MDFQIHIPQHSIGSNPIACLWELSGGHHYTEYILPQGVIEIVFNLAEPMKGQLPNSSKLIQAPLCFIQEFIPICSRPIIPASITFLA